MSDTTLTALVMSTGLVAFVFAALAWDHRHTAPAARPLAVLLASVGLWDIGYGLGTGRVPLPSPHLWVSIMYTGVAVAPTALLVFALHVTQHESLLTSRVRVALSVEPAITVLAAWTDGRFGLMFHGVTTIEFHPQESAGPLFWSNVVYTYALMAASTVLLLRFHWIHKHTIYRWQATSMLVSVLLPWIGSLSLVLGLARRDPTPITLSISACLFGFALLRLRMLEVVPIARSLLVERMSDGMLVTDASGVICDINAAGRAMLPLLGPDPVGKSSDDCLRDYPQLAALMQSSNAARIEFESTDQSPTRYIDVTMNVIEDHRHEKVGTVAMLRDITDRKHLESELALLARVDPLTGVGNRRAFEEAAEREFNRRKRTNQPLSLTLIDVDHLRLLNDQGGHRAGDEALEMLGRALRQESRATDVAVRLGGDEFAILLPDTPMSRAAEVLERVRSSLRSQVNANPAGVPMSISVGVSEAEANQDTIDSLLRRADAALYRAKADGRDCIRVSA